MWIVTRPFAPVMPHLRTRVARLRHTARSALDSKAEWGRPKVNGGWCRHQPPLRRAAPVSVSLAGAVLDRSGVAALPRTKILGWSAALLGMMIAGLCLAARLPSPSLPAPVRRFPATTLRRAIFTVSLRLSSGAVTPPFPSEPVSLSTG